MSSKESRPNHHQLSYTQEQRDFLDKKLGSTDRKSRIKAINKLLLSENKQDPNLTTKEKLEKVKLANETIKIWKEFKQSGFTVEQLGDFVNDGVMPYMDNPVFSKDESREDKPVLTFGKTTTHTPRKIKQEDGTLRCKHCNRAIPMRAFDCEQLDDYRKHVEQSHGVLDEEERIELVGLYDN